MKVVSVNAGLPQEFLWRGVAVRTAIFKRPVEGPVAVRELNLAGDRQADLTVHGGAQKAVYAYPAEHYAYWRRELPEVAFSWGQFGENLTTEGLLEDALNIGDRLRIGTAVLTVTQPRMPCYKLALRFGRDDMIGRFLRSGRHGFYFSVVQEGVVSAAAEIEILGRDPNEVTVADISRLYLDKRPDRELLQRALRVSALPPGWKDWLATRAQERPAEGRG